MTNLDASDKYSVLMGADKIESSTGTLETVTIKAGKYLVFSAEGDVPQIVIDTWQVI